MAYSSSNRALECFVSLRNLAFDVAGAISSRFRFLLGSILDQVHPVLIWGLAANLLVLEDDVLTELLLLSVIALRAGARGTQGSC